MNGLYVKNINTGLKVGDTVPKQNPKNPGNVGKWVEKQLRKHGLDLKPNGIDIPTLGVELKTRNVHATSPMTVCRMTKNDIISLDFEKSFVCDCLKNLLIIKYDDNTNKIVSMDVHNLTRIPIVYQLFDQCYTGARNSIVQENTTLCTARVNKGALAYFEFKPDSDDCHFRISNTGLSKVENFKNSPGLKLFETTV
jgi:hypothetical protein